MVKTKKRTTDDNVKLNKKGVERASITNSRIEKYYNKIVVAFVVLTCILVVMIVYFSFSKTEIVITTGDVKQEISITNSIMELDGVVFLTESEGSKTYDDLNATKTKAAKATGEVTIYNKYSRSQPLVATTRLLSADGVLFRTQETVTVPAGGEVKVEVIADEEGAQGDIEATTFEIVALWEGLKKDIYAKSSEAMTGGEVEIGVVTQNDIANARTALSEELISNAQELFQKEMSARTELPADPYLPISACTTEAIDSKVDTEAGSEVDGFTVTEKVSVACPVIDKTLLVEFIEAAGSKQIAEGYRSNSTIGMDDINISLIELNDDKSDGNLEITVTVNATINLENELLLSSNLTNKSEQEIITYLTAFDEISDVQVHFSPFWVTRTPSLADHIQISIK